MTANNILCAPKVIPCNEHSLIVMISATITCNMSLARALLGAMNRCVLSKS